MSREMSATELAEWKLMYKIWSGEAKTNAMASAAVDLLEAKRVLTR